ncbi:MAG: hypothetical protein ACT4QB_15645 [Gammaproteobacteria bacterium]
MPTDTISKTIGVVTELTVIAPLKEGGAARLRQVLANLQTNAGGPLKKIDTIHFARWVIFDNDTRMLFTSNFDGSLGAYLRDFCVETPEGMDSIFGNCEGYPPGGCADFEAFTAYVRKHQVPTDLFYPAYPESTVKAVKKALEVKALADQLLEKLA